MDNFLGEIRMTAFGLVPRGWLRCDGQMLSIQQNTALFSLLGTQYGGNGTTTFALPDYRGRVPLCALPNTNATAEKGGVETVALTAPQMPSHSHALTAKDGAASAHLPANDLSLATATDTLYAAAGTTLAIAPGSIASSGNNATHENMQPFATVQFIIATTGLYPSRP